jgi:hypothetical protein
MICSNSSINGVTLHKIKVDWGDGYVDVAIKKLKEEMTTINSPE